jgi:hypothetical protein
LSNDAAVKAKLAELLGAKLSAVEVPLYTANGVELFNFGIATQNVVGILFDFWKKHGRAPNLIFNDGLPEAWKPALAAEGGEQGLLSPLAWSYEWYGEGETRQVNTNIDSLYMFNCKMWAVDAPVTYSKITNVTDSSETVQTFSETLNGPVNSRVVYKGELVNIPRQYFTGGTFQTWGILLVALDHPEYVYATDEGCFLTMDGVAMLERSAAYWWNVGVAGAYGKKRDENLIWEKLGRGPVVRGIPNALIENLRKMFEKQQSTKQPLRLIIYLIVTFVGFYYGASAASGLVGGAFTISNLSGTLSLASKFGIDTGQVSSALKIVGALTGNVDLVDTVRNSAGTPIMDDFDFWGAMDADSMPIDYGANLDFGWDMADAGSYGVVDPTWDIGTVSNADFYSMLEVDPVTLEYGGDLSATQNAMSEVMGDWGPSPEAYNDAQILAEQNDMLSHYMNAPVSAVQYVSMAGSSPIVNAAAQVAMRAAGGSSTSPTTTPQTIARAQQIAQQQQLTASNTQDADIWSVAAKALQMYGQYQQQQYQQQARLPTTRTPQYPATTGGALTRQPDGSVTIRNADGSMTTIRPDGRTIQTGANSSLPQILADNKVWLIAGAAGLAALAILFIPSRR